jgi:biopolymer transport protein ExbB
MDAHGLAAALRAGGATIYPLLALAVAAVAVILEKAFVFAARARPPARLTALTGGDVAWDALERELPGFDARNCAARLCRVVAANRKRPVWWIESRAAEEASAIETSLGRWLWTLETIVTAAPLLGLLGTIIGMIRAFRLFGAEGLVDPRGVTGGVAEALVATAAGLLIAVVALLAFNYFSQRLAQVMDDLELLATRLVDSLRLEGEGAP